MAKVLFVTEQYIRENTVFNANVDTKDIFQSAGPAQDMHIQPILGTVFYNELELAYSAQTLTVDEEELVLMMKPSISYHAASMTLPFLAYSIKNKGPQTQSGDNSTSIDTSVFHFLRKEIENRAEFYTQRLIAYLDANASKFPTYNSSMNNGTDIVPNKQVSAYKNQIGLYGDGCDTYIDGIGRLRRY